MTMQNQPYIKPERVDNLFPAYQPPPVPPTQHRPGQTLQSRPTHQPGQANPGQHGAPKKPAPQEKPVDVESLPDFPSIKGMFGWTTIDDVNVPYILRSDKQFVSVRIVEMKLLSRYPNSYPDDLGKHAPLTSFFVTDNEAKLLNEINLQHCDGEYGKKDFNSKDLIVLLTDFIKFFELVKKTFPNAKAARAEHQQTAGWLQINNTVTPYLSRDDGRYVPLSVIQFAAGLLTNEKVNSVIPSKHECETLNNACKQAGVAFTFTESNELIRIKDLLRINPVEIIALPTANPLKHATFMELPTKNSSKQETKTPAASSQKTQQPYRFQPNPNLNLSVLQGTNSHGTQKAPSKESSDRHRISTNTERAAKEYSERVAKEHIEMIAREQKERAAREQKERAAREQKERALREQKERLAREQAALEQVTYPPHMNMQGMSMFPPHLAAMYRHPSLGLPQFIPQNPHAPHHNPLTQYYLNLSQQPQRHGQGPPNQQAPPGGVIPGRDVNARSPGSSSSTNPSPRSRPPSGSRPPSASRPPSQPAASPLSPTSRTQGFPPHSEIPLPSHGGVPPPAYPGLNVHQLQAMMAQRLPFHFPQGIQGVPPQPPPAHKQPVSPKHIPPTSNGLVNGSAPLSLSSPTHLSHTHTGAIPAHSKPTSQHKPTHHTTSPGKSDSQKSPVRTQAGTIGGPPPLIMMGPATRVNGAPINGMTVPQNVIKPTVQKDQISALPVTPEKPPNTEVSSDITPAVPQTLTVNTAKQKSPYVDQIQGAWLNNKSISCLQLEGQDRQGRYCLVEAVCKLYFNGCSVNEFLFALEKVLNVPLLTCDESEEAAFIQYYNLPVDVLKCNKMIKFDDLETYFPQLSYMFPDKNATDALLGQDTLDVDNNNMNKLDGNGVVTAADLEDSMPMTMAEMGLKRPQGDTYEADAINKKLRTDDADDAVIILD